MKTRLLFVAFVVPALLMACVSGDTQLANEGGISGTGVTAVSSGRITGFGSIYVNGVKFDTDSAQVFVEGDLDDLLSLAVGMVVTVEGEVNTDGLTGTATRVEFADDVEGVVQTNGGTSLTVMGQTVHVLRDTVFANSSGDGAITDIASVPAGAVVEVSGYSAGDGAVYATRVELKSVEWNHSDALEVKGVIASVSGSTFTIGALIIDWSEAASLELPDGAPAAGLHVQVTGTRFDTGSGHFVADHIELEGDGVKAYAGEEGEALELEGVITTAYANGEFAVNGQRVLLGTGALDEALLPEGVLLTGRRVEVEGRFNAEGVLVAEGVELGVDETSAAELTGAAARPSLESPITLMGVALQTSASTVFVDESVLGSRSFKESEILEGDWLEVYGQPVDGVLVATRVVRKTPEGNSLWELEGRVEMVDDASSAFTVAGVTVSAIGTTLPQVDNRVEVSGTFSGGILAAESISIGSD